MPKRILIADERLRAKYLADSLGEFLDDVVFEFADDSKYMDKVHSYGSFDLIITEPFSFLDRSFSFGEDDHYVKALNRLKDSGFHIEGFE